MVKRQLDGAVDESSAEQEIRKSNAIVHINLWIIWRPTPSGTGSYGRLAGRQTKLGRSMTF